MYWPRNSIESSKSLEFMNEPLMSTPMNMTRRPAFGASAASLIPAGTSAATHAGVRSIARRTARERVRMSGRLSGPRGAQLHGQGARVLEILHGVERQLQEVPISDEQRDEVDRGRDDLHRRHEERVQEALPFRADPLKFL